MRYHLAGTLIRSLRRLDCESPLTDGELLRRFIDADDHHALGLLIRRHGPLVYGVCTRLLCRAEDVEDVFQNVFTVLTRKAGRLRGDRSIASWLYGVTWREAAKVRHQRRRCGPAAEMPVDTVEARPAGNADLAELAAVLGEEVRRLPVGCREAVLLCYFEGQTQDQATRHLGCSLRTLQYRLQHGRELLRQFLTRRGYAVSAAGLATLLTCRASAASLPCHVVTHTVSAIVAADQGRSAVVALAGWVGCHRWLLAGALLGAAALGAAEWLRDTEGPPNPNAPAVAEPAAPPLAGSGPSFAEPEARKEVKLAAVPLLAAEDFVPPADLTPFLPANNATEPTAVAAGFKISYRTATFPNSIRTTALVLPANTPPDLLQQCARAVASRSAAYDKFVVRYGSGFAATAWFKVHIDPLYFAGVIPGYVPPIQPNS